MELEELKTAWQEMELRLERTEALNRKLVADVQADKARSALRWFGWAQAIELAFWFALVIFVAPFWIAHRGTPHFLVSGLVLHLYGVAAICLAVAQLLQYARVHYAGPVLDVQKRVAELHRLRATGTLLLGLPWCLLWVPLVIVAAKDWFDIDIYSPRWTVTSLGFGLAVMLAMLFYARRQLDRRAGAERRRRILDNLAGCSLTRAQRHLDEVARFADQ
jgi:hypothetical protein